MNPISKSTLSAIAFYDAVGKVPLTKVELYKYLIRTKNLPDISFGNFCKELEENMLESNPYISQYRGFYFLKKNNGAYRKRIQIGKTSIKKWRIAKRMSKIISFLPYVRMVAITGSLAQHTTNKNSDIDMLIVAKSGHIWTTRLLVSAAMHMLGKRRYGQKIKDRICLNHYIADTKLILRPKDLFSAHICTSFVPLWSKNQTNKRFVENNIKLINLYLPYFRKTHELYLAGHSQSTKLSFILPATIEFLIPKAISGKLDALFKTLQLRKIHKSIEKKQVQEGCSIAPLEEQDAIFDDNALVFHHPRPQNQKALFLYKENLKELGCL